MLFGLTSNRFNLKTFEGKDKIQGFQGWDHNLVVEHFLNLEEALGFNPYP